MLHKKIVLYLVSDISYPNVTECQVYAGHSKRDERDKTCTKQSLQSCGSAIKTFDFFFFFCYDSTKSELAKIKSKAE